MGIALIPIHRQRNRGPEQTLSTQETRSGVYIHLYVILHSNSIMHMLTNNDWKVKIVNVVRRNTANTVCVIKMVQLAQTDWRSQKK